MLEQVHKLMKEMNIPSQFYQDKYFSAFSMLAYPTAFKSQVDQIGLRDLKPIFFNIFKENSYNLKLQFFKDPLI